MIEPNKGDGQNGNQCISFNSIDISHNYTYNNERYKKYQCFRSHKFGEFVEYKFFIKSPDKFQARFVDFLKIKTIKK